MGYMMVALGTAAASGAMAVRTGRAVRARRSMRAAYLDACLPVLDDGRVRLTPAGLPRMSGTCRGHAVDVQAVADTLSYRKLPALWLIVTMPGPMPLRAVTDLMLRPRGTETFSHHMSLPHQIAAPAGLPADCALRTDDPGHVVAAAPIARALDRLGTDRTKEIILSPKGLRIVWLAEEADRARYLLFRDAEMCAVPVAAAVLSDILGAMCGLRDEIVSAASPDGTGRA